MKKRSTLMEGAAVLGMAAIVSKLLGIFQKIPLQNIAGDKVFGLYNAVFPFFTLTLFLATAGIPVAVSKFVSESVERGDFAEARRILKVASILMIGTGAVFSGWLFVESPRIAGWIGNDATIPALRSLAGALIFIPLMAALRGYFQGLQQMTPTGLSQVTEQFARVVTMIGLILYLTAAGVSDDWVAAGATFGSVTGSAVGLIVMMGYWRRHAVQTGIRSSIPLRIADGFRMARKLIRYALPVCLGAVAVPVLGLIDTFTVPRMLASGGLGQEGAMTEYGIYARGFPLVQLVAMIFSSMSVALVPSIAEAAVRGDRKAILHRSESAIRWSWLIGTAASFGLALAAAPVNVMLYRNDIGTAAMTVLAFSIMFGTLQIVTSSVLQGLGSAAAPALHLMAAAVLKVGLNLLWVPRYGIEGAALAAVAAYALAAVLNVLVLYRLTKLPFKPGLYLFRPLVAVAGMAATVGFLRWGMPPLLGGTFGLGPPRAVYMATALVCVTAGSAVFLAVAVRTGAIRSKELDSVPGLPRSVRTRLNQWSKE